MSNVLKALDLNGYDVTIQLTGDFTSQGEIFIYYPIGAGIVTLQGDPSDITAVKIKKLSFEGQKALCQFILDNFTFINTSAGSSSLSIINSTVYHGRLVYKSAGFVINVNSNGLLLKADNCTIQYNAKVNESDPAKIGDLACLMYCSGNSTINIQEAASITYFNGPTFGLGAFYVEGLSFVNVGNVTQSGSFSGSLYVTSLNSNSTIRKQDYSYQSS